MSKQVPLSKKFQIRRLRSWLDAGVLCVHSTHSWILEASIRLQSRQDVSTVVAGDFNAKARTWGSAVDDARGAALEEFAASLGLCAENVGSVTTFAASRGL